MNKWPMETLSMHIASIESGSRPKGGVSKYSDGVPSLSAEHIRPDGLFIFEKIKYVPQDFYHNASRGIIRKDDILIVKDGATTGKSAIVEDNFPFSEAMINEHTFVLRTKSSLHPKYCFYCLRGEFASDCFDAAKRKGVIGSLSKSFTAEIDIPIPAMEEQRRIVSRIEALTRRADQARRLRQEAIGEAETMLAAGISEVLANHDYEKARLGDCIFPKDTWNARRQPRGSIRYIEISGIDNKCGLIISTKKVDAKTAPSRAKRIVHTGDVIFATTRPNLKNIAIVPNELDGEICSTGFCVLRPRTGLVLSGWLFLVTRSDWFISQIVRHDEKNAYPSVSDNEVLAIEIPIPAMERQETIVKHLNAIRAKTDDLSHLQFETDAELAAFTPALLAKAFRGEL